MKTTLRTLLLTGLFTMAGHAADNLEQLLEQEIVQCLRIVEDPDGQTNVRSGPSTKAKVVAQVPSGGVVTVFPEDAKDGWERVDDNSENEHYIHSSRLKSVKAWKQIGAPTLGGDDQSAVLKQAGAEIQVKSRPFNAKQHTITKDENGQPLVDGGQVWGQDGGLPARTIEMTVKLGGKEVPLPKEALQHLYEPFMESLVLLTPGDPAKQALIVMTNGDGAGGYCVAWAFENGGYRGRAVFVPF
ncbi:MAG: SH3 domain-containing protein [Prosthecobacter sp.]